MSDERDMLAAKYGECFRAVDVLEQIPGIDCDKLRKEIILQITEEAERLNERSRI